MRRFARPAGVGQDSGEETAGRLRLGVAGDLETEGTLVYENVVKR